MLSELQRQIGDFVLGRTELAPAGIRDDGITPAMRLAIHRHSARTALTKALATQFPAVERLVGAGFFAMAAARFIASEPPNSPRLLAYGEGFADTIAGIEEAASVPYLADVARLEWACGRAAGFEYQQPISIDALAALAPEHAPLARLRLHASMRLLELDHPADTIVNAVLADDDDALARLDPLACPVRLAVYQRAQRVIVSRLDAAEWAFVQGLSQGQTLGSLVAQAGDTAALLLAAQFTAGRIGEIDADGG